MKNKVTGILLALALTIGLASISTSASAYWHHGYYHHGWHGGWRGGWGGGVYVGPGYGYGYRRCGWMPGHWRAGYWVPAHRACW